MTTLPVKTCQSLGKQRAGWNDRYSSFKCCGGRYFFHGAYPQQVARQLLDFLDVAQAHCLAVV